MVAMTTEIDKTQNSIALTAKMSANSNFSSSNLNNSEEIKSNSTSNSNSNIADETTTICPTNNATAIDTTAFNTTSNTTTTVITSQLSDSNIKTTTTITTTATSTQITKTSCDIHNLMGNGISNVMSKPTASINITAVDTDSAEDRNAKEDSLIIVDLSAESNISLSDFTQATTATATTGAAETSMTIESTGSTTPATTPATSTTPTTPPPATIPTTPPPTPITTTTTTIATITISAATPSAPPTPTTPTSATATPVKPDNTTTTTTPTQTTTKTTTVTLTNIKTNNNNSSNSNKINNGTATIVQAEITQISSPKKTTANGTSLKTCSSSTGNNASSGTPAAGTTSNNNNNNNNNNSSTTTTNSSNTNASSSNHNNASNTSNHNFLKAPPLTSGSHGGAGSSSSSSSQHGAGSSSKNASNTGVVSFNATANHSKRNEDAPNILVYKKMEAIIERMQAESTGVTVRTVKAFMSKVPSVFTGADLIAWIMKNFDVTDVQEALHFAHLLAAHGYIFPIDDHVLTVKNDGTFYRFQTPYFWPSNCWEPENTDYAVYLCKRTMQNKTRLELADYEAENLAKLQKMFSRKWEFIFMQAESQSKVAKKRDKLERKVLDSQERAFWDVHRPMPGCVNTTEIDIKKAYRRGASSHGTGSAGASVAKNPIEQLTRIITLRKQKLERRTIKVSKAAEALVAYYEQYSEFDYFITAPELPNPWQTDSTEMWDAEKNSKEVPLRRVKRWAFSLPELLNDPIGREQFAKFLEKEYSGENLKFWESVQQMKALPQSEIKEAINRIWQEFLAPDAPCPVNVDSKSVELAREAVSSTAGPNRWCFDVAAAHVYHLMKSDSYSRYLRSEMYKDYLNCSRKKIKSIPNLFGVKR